MNQKTVIYIILSTILLYLYYRRGGLDIFAGFIVLILSTMVFGDVIEGAKNKSGSGDECKKMGFEVPKIDKKDINGSLEKVMKNIEKVAKTYWGFEKGDIEGKRTEDKTLEKNWSEIKNTPYWKSLNSGENKKDIETLFVLLLPAYELYEKFIIKKLTDEEKDKFLKEKIMTKLDETVKGSDSAVKIVTKFKNSDEMKDLDKDANKLLKYFDCLAKQWASIFKALKASGEDEEEDEEEEDEEEEEEEEESDDD